MGHEMNYVGSIAVLFMPKEDDEGCMLGEMYLLGKMLSYSGYHIFLGRSWRQVIHVMELPVLL